MTLIIKWYPWWYNVHFLTLNNFQTLVKEDNEVTLLLIEWDIEDKYIPPTRWYNAIFFLTEVLLFLLLFLFLLILMLLLFYLFLSMLLFLFIFLFLFLLDIDADQQRCWHYFHSYCHSYRCIFFWDYCQCHQICDSFDFCYHWGWLWW